MMDVDYYRQQAERAHRLAAEFAHRPDIAVQFDRTAKDYGDIVADLEAGAIESGTLS